MSVHPARSWDDATVEVLKKGSDFAIAPRRNPVEDIVCRVEDAIRCSVQTAKVIRQDTSHILKSSPPRHSISKQEQLALSHLGKTNSVILLPDKGINTVTVDTIDYRKKLPSLLEPMGKFVNQLHR